MTESNRERIEEFIRGIGRGLGTANTQTEQILAEVQSDLDTHVERRLAEGFGEDEAVDQALAEMGNPYELAHHMRQEVPPFGGNALTVIRYVAAAVLILWTLLMLWVMRAGSYGFSPVLIAVVVLLHFPAIMLLWPRVVWRRNFLFGLIPAGLLLAGTLFAAMAGVQSEPIELQVTGEGVDFAVGAPVPVDDGSTGNRAGVLVAIGLTVFSGVLVLAMQRRAQRRTALISLAVAVGVVEAAYQLEELRFRADREQVRAYLENSFKQNGAYPSEEELMALDGISGARRISLNATGGDFTLYWPRPLNSGHSIVYASEDDRIWVND